MVVIVQDIPMMVVIVYDNLVMAVIVQDTPMMVFIIIMLVIVLDN